jgi:hypothetical protein
MWIRALAAFAVVITLVLSTTRVSADAADDAKKKDAQAHFERGLQLSTEEVWDAALAEYMLSRQLYPTKAATKNAALCLRKLRRFDEALDMIESFQRDFQNLNDQDKQFASKLKGEIEPYVGTLQIKGGPSLTAISIDGRDRGQTPLPAVRVSAGTHVVRAYKEGFSPFEARIDVAGKQTATVELRIEALSRSGKLRVVEQSGKKVDTIIDDVVVGKTPWEGSMSPGSHMVVLRGEGNLGTQPASAPVRVDDTTTLNLSVEALDSELRVECVPVSAAVALDGVTLGRGVWEGRVRTGKHSVEGSADGFVPAKRAIVAEAGKKTALKIELERVVVATPTGPPSRVYFDLRGAFALAPLGGDLGGLALGPMGQLQIGYQLGSGFGIGVEVGYARLGQKSSGRTDTLTPQPVGSIPPEQGTTDDDVRLHGLLAGLSAGIHRGKTVTWLARLGAGAWLATATDTRSGHYTTVKSVKPDGTTGAPTAFDVAPIDASFDAKYIYIAPEARIGYRLGDHFELTAGVQLMVLVALTQPSWQPATKQVLTGTCGTPPTPDCVTDGVATWGNTAFTSKTAFVAAPGLGARLEF